MDDITQLSNMDMWSLVVGFALPPLIAFISSARWPSWARALAAVVVCLIGGGVTAAVSGYYTGVPVLRAVMVTLVAALAFYRIFWRPSGIAPWIERQTTPRLPWWYTPDGASPDTPR